MRGGWEVATRNSLLRNDGDLTFTDVTERAGLAGPAHRTHSAAWADFDGDGWLDVFLGHEFSWSRLMRNRGDGTFEDVSERAGIRFRSLTKAVVAGDFDNDGWQDVYVSNFGERNLLFRNLGQGRFEEVARERGVSEPYYSFTSWFFDYDNDGWLDLLVVTDVPTAEEQAREYLGLPQPGETLRVFHNRGDGTFEDATRALGLARVIPTMGANFGDIDNDGWLDVYLGTGAPSYATLLPNRMFRNREGRAFVDVTQATGTGHLQKGHGVAFADFDNDGDDDLFASLGGAFPGDKYPDALFENPGHGASWLGIRLVGRRANRAAIGARLRVVVDEAGRETQRTRSVTSGGSFGASPLAQHVGLGRGASREARRDRVARHARDPDPDGSPDERVDRGRRRRAALQEARARRLQARWSRPRVPLRRGAASHAQFVKPPVRAQREHLKRIFRPVWRRRGSDTSLQRWPMTLQGIPSMKSPMALRAGYVMRATRPRRSRRRRSRKTSVSAMWLPRTGEKRFAAWRVAKALGSCVHGSAGELRSPAIPIPAVGQANVPSGDVPSIQVCTRRGNGKLYKKARRAGGLRFHPRRPGDWRKRVGIEGTARPTIQSTP